MSGLATNWRLKSPSTMKIGRVSVYKPGNCSRYYLAWRERDPAGVSVKMREPTGSRDFVDAATRAREITMILERGERVGKAAERSLGAFLEAYAKDYQSAGAADLRASREKSWKKDKACLERFVGWLESKGVKTVRAVTPDHAATWVASMKRDDERAATINKRIRVCRAAFNYASGDAQRLIDVNPFLRVKKVKTATYEPKAIETYEAIDAVLKAAVEIGPDSGALVYTAMFTGLRSGELAALRVPDVQGGWVHVKCSEEHATKGRKPRSVPLCQELAPVLAAHIGTRASGLVFARPDGAPLTDFNIVEAFEVVERKCGVYVRAQVCRRTFANILADRGYTTVQIRDLLGHQSISTTESYYLARNRVPKQVSFGSLLAPVVQLGAKPVTATQGSASNGGTTGP